MPGPRVLAPTYDWGQRALTFPKWRRTPNPAALSACRLSRNIALRHYRLVFGTTNIYADLSIDVFYVDDRNGIRFGPHDNLWGGDIDLQDGRESAKAVIDDLESITHLMLGSSFSRDYGILGLRGPNGYPASVRPGLKTDLLRFKSLKVLLLGCGGSERSGWHGQIYVEHDIMKFKPMSDRNFSWGDSDSTAQAIVIKSHFFESHTEEEIARGIPEVQLVQVAWLPDRTWREGRTDEERRSEIYVS
jgi:hypothetical protein